MQGEGWLQKLARIFWPTPDMLKDDGVEYAVSEARQMRNKILTKDVRDAVMAVTERVGK